MFSWWLLVVGFFAFVYVCFLFVLCSEDNQGIRKEAAAFNFVLFCLVFVSSGFYFYQLGRLKLPPGGSFLFQLNENYIYEVVQVQSYPESDQKLVFFREIFPVEGSLQQRLFDSEPSKHFKVDGVGENFKTLAIDYKKAE